MEINFQLRERTAMIVGPYSSTMQRIVMSLCEHGVDCFLVVPEDSVAKKYCQSITDLRETNRKNGRAAAIRNDLKSEVAVKDAIGEAVKAFGSVDLFIDMNLSNRINNFKIGEPLTNLEHDVRIGLTVPVTLAHAALSFFKSRQRGRILFFMNGNSTDPVESAIRGALVSFSQTLAKQVSEYNVTVNCLSLGLTEEWVLAQYPQATSIKEALIVLKEKDPSLKITEPEKISNTVAWLMSQYGLSVTGQCIELK